MKNSYFITAFIALLIYSVVVSVQVKRLNNKIEVMEARKLAGKAKKTSDSITAEKKQELSDLVKQSDSASNQSSKIIKSIEHEKITVRDTTYDAMCKYIQNYRSN